MFKYFFALALLSGSISVFADSYYDDSSGYNDTSRTVYPDEYSDTTSSSMSSTSTTDSMSPDTTVTGTMAPEVSATDEYQKLHVGILSGLDKPEGSATSSSPEFGVDVGYQPTSIFGVGIEASTTTLDRVNEARRTMALLKGTANLSSDTPILKSMFVGGAVGPVISESRVRVGGGPLVGFDIPVSGKNHDYLSLGANAKYVFTTDTPDSLIAVLAVKYWF